MTTIGLIRIVSQSTDEAVDRQYLPSRLASRGPGADTDTVEQEGFGELVHRWRDRISPRDVGITVTTSRRAPGLRREELAALAGLSTDYLIRLEQARATRPSEQVVATLARALQLSRAERDQLYTAAGVLPPRDGRVNTHVPAGVQRLIARLGHTPLAVFAADWRLLHWNDAWSALHGDPAALPQAERNLMRAIFGKGPAHASLHPVRSDTHYFEASIVADLKQAASTYPDDTRLSALVTGLLESSPPFAQLWADSAPARHTTERKTITHPLVGDITLDCDVLDVPGADLHLVTYTTAAGSNDDDKLSLLGVGAIRGMDPAQDRSADSVSDGVDPTV